MFSVSEGKSLSYTCFLDDPYGTLHYCSIWNNIFSATFRYDLCIQESNLCHCDMYVVIDYEYRVSNFAGKVVSINAPEITLPAKVEIANPIIIAATPPPIRTA